jgi:predicted ribosomally synthesized peptide with nif11-like leader
MSVETARKFVELLAEDDAMQHQFNTTNPVGAEAVLQFAQAKGFIITEADLRTVLEDYPGGERLLTHLDGRATGSAT